MRSTTPGRRVAPSGGSARGGKRLRQLQSPSAVQRKRVLGIRGDYRRGYLRSAALLFGDPFGSNRKQTRSTQKPKTMPLHNSPMDLCRDMRSLSISDVSAADLSFSEKGDWDGEDGLAMQILTATWFDDLSPSPYNDDSGCGSSRSSSISSGCRTNSWESIPAAVTPPVPPVVPKPTSETPETPRGLNLNIDVGFIIQNFQTAVLPYGNIDMYMQNRSQYHRLAQGGNKEEFKQVKCSCCDFLYTVPIEQ